MGWRSAEQAYKMRLRMHRSPSERQEVGADRPQFDKSKGKQPKSYADADVPEGLPDRFYDEEGEVNLSKTTLKDAVQYMNAIGIKMPMPTKGVNQYGGRIAKSEELPTMDDLFQE